MGYDVVVGVNERECVESKRMKKKSGARGVKEYEGA